MLLKMWLLSWAHLATRPWEKVWVTPTCCGWYWQSQRGKGGPRYTTSNGRCCRTCGCHLGLIWQQGLEKKFGHAQVLQMIMAQPARKGGPYPGVKSRTVHRRRRRKRRRWGRTLQAELYIRMSSYRPWPEREQSFEHMNTCAQFNSSIRWRHR